MAIHIPRYPFNMIDNDLYHHLRDTYEVDRLDTWNKDDLVAEFGQAALDDMVRRNLLIVLSSRDKVKLSFKQAGTVTNIIVTKSQKDCWEFHQMRDLLPKNQKCSSSFMKNYLSFLVDFNEVQTFPTPGAAYTTIAAEGEIKVIEKTIDDIFSFSAIMEPRYIHQISVDDGVTELNSFYR